jgi:hypothetical protein
VSKLQEYGCCTYTFTLCRSRLHQASQLYHPYPQQFDHTHTVTTSDISCSSLQWLLAWYNTAECTATVVHTALSIQFRSLTIVDLAAGLWPSSQLGTMLPNKELPY